MNRWFLRCLAGNCPYLLECMQWQLKESEFEKKPRLFYSLTENSEEWLSKKTRKRQNSSKAEHFPLHCKNSFGVLYWEYRAWAEWRVYASNNRKVSKYATCLENRPWHQCFFSKLKFARTSTKINVENELICAQKAQVVHLLHAIDSLDSAFWAEV